MLTNKHLAVMSVRRVIFHDVPNHLKGEAGNLILASAEAEIDTATAEYVEEEAPPWTASKNDNFPAPGARGARPLQLETVAAAVLRRFR